MEFFSLKRERERESLFSTILVGLSSKKGTEFSKSASNKGRMFPKRKKRPATLLESE